MTTNSKEYQRKYMHGRYHSDKVFKEKIKKINRERRQEKYGTDPIFTQKAIASSKKWRDKKRKEKQNGRK